MAPDHDSSSVWFRIDELNPAATRRTFCLAQAGAGASVFRQWDRSLPPDVQVVPVQLPGRESLGTSNDRN